MSPYQKLAILSAILLEASANVFFANESYNSSVGWSVVRHIQMSMPLVISANNSLIHVLDSRQPDYPIRLESTDHSTCLVFLKLRYPSRYPRRATALGNGKIIVWLLNYHLTPFKHLGEWRFVIVEPRNCTYRDFEIKDSDPHPIDVIGVVGYNDTFDVLIASLVHEEPRFTYVYRYDDEASPVSSFNVSAIPDLDSQPFYRPYTIRVHAAKEHEPSDGYFYVQSKPLTSVTVIKRLDSTFTRIGGTKLSHSKFRGFDFNSYSTKFGNFSVCRYYERQHSIHCSLLDGGTLNQRVNVVLNYVSRLGPKYRKLVHINVMNTPDGGVVLTYGFKMSFWPETPIYVQRIGPEGWANDSVMMGKILCEIYDVQNFYVAEDVYCVVVTCDEEVHTRCLRMKRIEL